MPFCRDYFVNAWWNFQRKKNGTFISSRSWCIIDSVNNHELGEKFPNRELIYTKLIQLFNFLEKYMEMF